MTYGAFHQGYGDNCWSCAVRHGVGQSLVRYVKCAVYGGDAEKSGRRNCGAWDDQGVGVKESLHGNNGGGCLRWEVKRKRCVSVGFMDRNTPLPLDTDIDLEWRSRRRARKRGEGRCGCFGCPSFVCVQWAVLHIITVLILLRAQMIQRAADHIKSTNLIRPTTTVHHLPT